MFLTNHNPLTHALSAAPSSYPPKETHHLDFISQFTSDIRHVHGKENPVKVALSRIDIYGLNCQSATDFTLLAASHQTDPEILAVKTSSSLCLQYILLPLPPGQFYVICQQLRHIPMLHLLTNIIFSIKFIPFRTLDFVLHKHSSQTELFGQV